MSVINFSGGRNYVLAFTGRLYRQARAALGPFAIFLVLWALPVGTFASALLTLAGELSNPGQLELFLAAPEFVAVSLGFFLVCFALERVAPYRAQWNRLGRAEAHDWWLYVSALGPAEFLARSLAFAGSAWLMRDVQAWPWFLSPIAVGSLWPEGWPFWIQLLLAFLIFDFVYYWYHRLGHDDRFLHGMLWRWHRLHHTPEYLIAQKSFRHSFPEWGADVLLHTSVFLLLGVPEQVVLTFYAITIPIGVLSHANLAIPHLPVLGDWLNLPATHRVHHDRELRGGMSNFSAFTMFWDHVFGTYVSPREYTPEALGLHADGQEEPIAERPLSLWVSFM